MYVCIQDPSHKSKILAMLRENQPFDSTTFVQKS